MTKDRVYHYYIEKDFNCAESALRAASDEYGLNLDDNALRLISAFGAGMGCMRVCGALSATLAALGHIKVDGRAHATEGFADLCGRYVERFERELGSTSCVELMNQYRSEEQRCLKTVELAAEALDRYLREEGGAGV